MLRAFQNTIHLDSLHSLPEPITGGKGVSSLRTTSSSSAYCLPPLIWTRHIRDPGQLHRRWGGPRETQTQVGQAGPRKCGETMWPGLAAEEGGADADSWERLLALPPRSQY